MKRKKFVAISIIAVFMVAIVVVSIYFAKSVKNKFAKLDTETMMAMNYAELTEESYNTDSEYVKFAAFFLRDIDQDGNANSISGTCKNVSQTDTLYMDINVLSKGYIKEGATITINGDNFKYKTAIVKDSVISENYISDNTKRINLNEIKNGTQKLVYGEITADINQDISRYSSDANTVTLDGIYVDDEGNETTISKTVNLTVDWYGGVEAEIPYSYAGGILNSTQKNSFKDIQLKEDDAVLTFTIATQEKKNEVILAENYIEGIIPELNGYKAKNVTIEGINIEYTWNEEAQKFTANRKAILNDDKITTGANSGSYYRNRYNEYKITVTYPKEAYNQIQGDTVNLIIPVSTYYLGYTNQNPEFNEEGQERGITKSNIATGTITVNYSIVTGQIYNFYTSIGKYAVNPHARYVVLKEKAIRGI